MTLDKKLDKCFEIAREHINKEFPNITEEQRAELITRVAIHLNITYKVVPGE